MGFNIDYSYKDKNVDFSDWLDTSVKNKNSNLVTNQNTNFNNTNNMQSYNNSYSGGNVEVVDLSAELKGSKTTSMNIDGSKNTLETVDLSSSVDKSNASNFSNSISSSDTNVTSSMSSVNSRSTNSLGSVSSVNSSATNSVGSINSSTTGSVGSINSSTTGSVGSMNSSSTGSVGSMKSSTTGSVGSMNSSSTGSVGSMNSSSTGSVGSMNSSSAGSVGSMNSSSAGSVGSMNSSSTGSVGSMTSSSTGSVGSMNSSSTGSVGSMNSSSTGSVGSMNSSSTGSVGSMNSSSTGSVGSMNSSSTGSVGSMNSGMAGSANSVNSSDAGNMTSTTSHSSKANYGSNRPVSTETVDIDTSDTNVSIDSTTSTVSDIDMQAYTKDLSNYGINNNDIKRLVAGEITLDELMNEINNDPDGTRRKNIMINNYVQQYTSLDFWNMDELDDEIRNLEKQIEELKNQKATFSAGEADCLLKIVNSLKEGYDLNWALEQVVAWEYTDENGDVCYSYTTNPFYDGKVQYQDQCRELTFKDLYGDSESLKQLQSLLKEEHYETGLFNKKDNVRYVWDDSSQLNNLFDSLSKQSTGNDESREAQNGELNEKIRELTQQKNYYVSIKDSINHEVDYYMKRIDKYVVQPDFVENSYFNEDYLSSLEKLKEKYPVMYGDQESSMTVTEIEDIALVLSCLINGKDISSDGVSINSNNNMISDYEKWIPYMSDAEKYVFNYKCNTGGLNEGYAYLNLISDELDQRWLSEERQEDQAYALEHPILASVGSIFKRPVDGLSAVGYSAYAKLHDLELRRTDVYSEGDTWRSTLSNSLQNTHGTGWSFAYSTCMSCLDSSLLMVANTLTGGSASLVLSATMMGSSAYTSSLNDALDRGLSDDKAMLFAFAAASCETFFENVSVKGMDGTKMPELSDILVDEAADAITKKVSSSITDQQLANIANHAIANFASVFSQGIAEGNEELLTEFTTNIADMIISGDLNSYVLTIQGYMKQGYSEAEATSMANRDYEEQLLLSWCGGAASGFAHKSVQDSFQAAFCNKSQIITSQVATTLREKYGDVNNGNSTISPNISVPSQSDSNTINDTNVSTDTNIDTSIDTNTNQVINDKVDNNVEANVDTVNNGVSTNLEINTTVNETLERLDDSVYSVDESLSALEHLGDDVVLDSVNNLAEQITMSNETLKSGGSYNISVNNISDLSLEELSSITNYENLQFTDSNGSTYSYGEVLDIVAANDFDSILKMDSNIPGAEYAQSVNEVEDIAFDTINSQIKDKLSLKGLYDSKEIGVLKFLAGLPSSFVIGLLKTKYTDVKDSSTMTNKIINEGVYHFTSLESANKILESGYIKATGNVYSYGKPKSFFFGGIPTFADTALNLGKFESKRVAVKIDVDENMVSDFKYRSLSDMALAHEGDYYIDQSKASIAYLCLTEENGKLVYKECTKEQFDNYTPNISSSLLSNTNLNVKNFFIGVCTDFDYFMANVKEAISNGFTDFAEFLEQKFNIVNSKRGGLFIGRTNQNYDFTDGIHNDVEEAIYFNDPKQFIYRKLDDLAIKHPRNIELRQTIDAVKLGIGSSVSNVSFEEMYKNFYKYLSRNDKKLVNSMYNSADSPFQMYSNVEKDLIELYTKFCGPVITAFLRRTVTNFSGTLLDGNNAEWIHAYLIRACNELQKGNLSYYQNVNNFVAAMDNIIEKAPPLKSNLIVYRGVNGLFINGNRLQTLGIGQRFNDSAYVSTSVLPSSISSGAQYVLQIELPAGTKAAYLEALTGVGNYNQHELLLGRNHTFEITSMPTLLENGKIVVNAKLVENPSSVVKSLNLDQIDSREYASNYYYKFYNNMANFNQYQIDLYDVISELRDSGMLARYEVEVRDLYCKNLYNFDIPEHNMDHVERVLLYSMYMGQKLNLSDTDMDILIEAAKLHDCGRINIQTDVDHGHQSALRVNNLLGDKYSSNDLNKIAAAIEYHEVNDSFSSFQKICSQYNISVNDYNSVYQLSTILKDADAIDRTRFPGNLNPSYLRNDIASQLIKSSCQIQEIRGYNSILSRIDRGDFTSDGIENMNRITQENHVPFYLLSYWLDYHVTSTYEWINSILNGG